MNEAESSRLDRVEAALEAMQQRMEQFDRYFENQATLNADLRARQQIQSQHIDQLIEVAELTLNSVPGLREEFRQHRSDSHGA